ncbi:polysaccharide deacetylase family protein [Streptomyces yaanensis]|uniref:Polysaccharide deacetylase family protein n=1 Tax=Streptomyces yaanensis TaxID=1142239 RepID=A0ABV7SJ22_9ACTN|nr:polysaccharide deacetylase family protein [Streptomyces sp. CGMCC 4.7035]WNC01269.1 polysaccharide deacetylase family protein [Streptomyces sp. CGMCC 4.7035]
MSGTFLAASAQAGGGRRHTGEAGGTTSGLSRVDLKGWAKAQLTADLARHDRQRENTSKTTLASAASFSSTSASAVDRQATLLSSPADDTAAADPTTLVLYDTAGPYGQLGELYAMATANLAGHFGTVTAKPVQQYTAGMIDSYTAVIYIGSTYYGGSIPDAIPAAFYQDAATTTKPVLWMGANIWGLANDVGVTRFAQKYGWDPTTSYYEDGGSVGTVTQVTYKNQALTRTIPAGQDGGVLRPTILTGSGYPAVIRLAEGLDTSNGHTFGWAIRSANLTYMGEIPFAYVSESDRVIVLEDLLFDALAPATTERHRAVVRLEDISPDSDPAELRSMADYLYAQNIPYGINVIPVYTDPNGTYNNGVPETVTLAQRPQVVSALKYMLARGAVLMDHGYTHQYGNVANPYNGVTGDDFEFYRAHVDTANNVVHDGPVAEDSTLWAQGRVTSALALFTAAGLPKPALWTTPHYAGSAADYKVFSSNFSARLERSLYFAGTLTGASSDPNRFIGQFFPYVVKDVYGTKVLPENIGNYEPEAYNNHPARLPADLIASAKANLAVRDGFAGFFYHPYYALQPLKDTIDGIKALGYTFVSPAAL